MATHTTNPALDRDLDHPDNPNHEFAQFGAGCFWGVELAFQRLHGVVKTEVGYSQGNVPDPTYKLVCTKTTNHVEVVRVQFDPEVCPYTNLLSLFWSRHDPTTLNRQVLTCLTFLTNGFLDFQSVDGFVLILQGGDVGTQYRSGIYYYNEAQENLARESKVAKQLGLKDNTVVTEILPAKRFYRAEEYHQQYLEKGGRRSAKQSAEKGCNDPIRCYG